MARGSQESYCEQTAPARDQVSRGSKCVWRGPPQSGAGLLIVRGGALLRGRKTHQARCTPSLVRFATPDPNPPAQSPGRSGYSSTSVVDPGRTLVPVHALNPVLLDAQDDPILRDVADGTARYVVL